MSFMVGSDLLKYAQRVGYSAQCARIQKRTRRQFIAAASRKSRGWRADFRCPRPRRSADAKAPACQIVPIKEMAFETLEPTHCFECAEVARHQIINGDVTEIICRHGRQHRKPDIGR